MPTAAIFTDYEYHDAKSNSFIFLGSRSTLPNFCSADRGTNQSPWLCKTGVTSVSHNNTNNGWQADHQRYSASALFYCANCLSDILKYTLNRLWYIFKSFKKGWNSPSISYLLFFFIWSLTRTRPSSLPDEFSSLWSVLSKLFVKMYFPVFLSQIFVWVLIRTCKHFCDVCSLCTQCVNPSWNPGQSAE